MHFFRRLGFVGAGVLGLLGCVACSSSSSGGASQESTNADGGSPLADGGSGVRPDAATNSCGIAAVEGVADVVPSFALYEPGTSEPPAMTGGPIDGSYVVDKATVYLPTSTKGLADPAKSTGAVNAWSVFNGRNYRMFLKAKFTISSVLGPQEDGADVVSQGAFVANAGSLTLDFACDPAVPKAAEYSFSVDNAAGRASILVKTGSKYGDTFLLLQAKKK
jgi:hypothetical protein